MAPLIIGFTGRRGVGKSEAARVVHSMGGFSLLHTFGIGKLMTIAYFMGIGYSQEDAKEMVDGKYKRFPAMKMPAQVTPQWFMERFGHFMGVELGPEFTIGVWFNKYMELYPENNIVLESIVYEANWVRQQYGPRFKLIRITRLAIDEVNPLSDAGVARIIPDFTINNNGTLEEFQFKVDKMAHDIIAGILPLYS